MIAALILSSFNEKMDIFLVSNLLGAGNTGLYGGILAIAMIPDVIGAFFATVLQPKIVGWYRSGEFERYQSVYFKVMMPLGAVVVLILMFYGDLAVPFILGNNYAPASNAFKWLIIGTVFWLVMTPFSMSLVALLQPAKILRTSIGQMVFAIGAGLLLIPLLGITGAGLLIACMRIIIAIWLIYLARKLVLERKETNDSNDEDQTSLVGNDDFLEAK